MCLGVPGQVLSVTTDALGVPTARVSFGGVVKEVCLAYVPEAAVGEWVLVHVGFALARVDEAEAARTLAALREEGSRDDGDAPPGPP